MSYVDPWETWHLHDEVTNGSEFGKIVRSDFKVRGEYQPMVRITEGPRARQKVWPWEKPRWVVMTEGESERAQALREDARRSADLAADTGDNRRTRDGRVTLAKWSPEFRRKVPRVRENATAEQRAALNRHRGDESNPFE